MQRWWTAEMVVKHGSLMFREDNDGIKDREDKMI